MFKVINIDRQRYSITAIVSDNINIAKPGDFPHYQVRPEILAKRMSEFFAHDYGFATVNLVFKNNSLGLKSLTAYSKISNQYKARFYSTHPKRDFILSGLMDINETALDENVAFASAGFFLLDPEEDDSIYSSLGQAYGVVYDKTEVVALGGVRRPALFRSVAYDSFISTTDPSEYFYTYGNIPQPVQILFRKHTDKSDRMTPRNLENINIVLVAGEVVDVVDGGGNAVPVHGIVLSYRKTDIKNEVPKIGARYSISYKKAQVDLVLQGSAKLISSRRSCISEKSFIDANINFPGTDLGIVPMFFDKSLPHSCNRPQSAIGLTDNGNYVWASFEPKEGHEMHLSVFANELCDINVLDAFLLDAGGSVRAYTKGERIAGDVNEKRGIPYFIYFR